MKRFSVMSVLGLVLLLLSSPVFAVPFLQLDIEDGVYDNATQTVYSTTSAFTLRALIDGTNKKKFVAGDTYYISAAVAPQVDASQDLGSLDFNTTTVDVTDDMTYGTAPIEEVAKNHDLPGHGIFETYFTEFVFDLTSAEEVEKYNSQDNTGIPLVADEGSGFWVVEFDVDVSELTNPDYGIHFDLYTKNTDGTIREFAPFSKDAYGGGGGTPPPPPPPPIPEPSTVLLLGAGLLGLVGLGRKRINK